jgi:hypothetical protein
VGNNELELHMTEVNSMTATNLATGEQATFSHQDPRMAFSFLHAQETNRLTHWAGLSDNEKLNFVADKVRIGERSWGFRDWAIPFFDENTQKGIYLETGGQKCPRCLSVHIEGGEVEVGGKTATQKVWCNECDATWFDHYTMTNVDIG